MRGEAEREREKKHFRGRVWEKEKRGGRKTWRADQEQRTKHWRRESNRTRVCENRESWIGRFSRNENQQKNVFKIKCIVENKYVNA